MLDWYTKKIVGWHPGESATTKQWLTALNLAVLRQFPDGIRQQGTTCLVSDNGSQPRLREVYESGTIVGIKQIFASYDNPEGNADTERVIRTLKEDLVWPEEWTSVYEFREELAGLD